MEDGEITVDFDGREVVYGFGELDELVLAYATTIHKSQGSEYPAIVIPLTMQHYTILQRNLVYTGVTRGKRLVVLVGQRKGAGDRGQRGADETTMVEARRVVGGAISGNEWRVEQHDADLTGTTAPVSRATQDALAENRCRESR